MVAGNATAHLDISANGKWLAATNRSGADLSVYNLEASEVERAHAVSIPLRGPGASSCHPYDIKFTSISDVCCVTDFDAGQLLIVDLASRQVTDRINVAKQCFGLELNCARDTAYVCTWDCATVAVIDLAKKKKIGEIHGFNGYTTHCALDEVGRQLVVTSQTNSGTGEARIVDLRTGSVEFAIRDEMMRGCIGVTIGE
jgi:DNA-binding beta-propeller fold protein YncE